MVNWRRALQVFVVGTLLMSVLIGIKTNEEVRHSFDSSEDGSEWAWGFATSAMPVLLAYTCGWGLVPAVAYVVLSAAASAIGTRLS